MTADSDDATRWRFRRARPDDEPVLLELFEESFSRKVTAQHWRWKLQRPGVTTAESWVGVDTDDRPVFHYGGMWCDVVIDDEILPAVVAVDSFTAPAVRRRGLLTLGASRAHQAWRDAGAAIVFGLPNEQLGSRANVTLGSTHIELRWWVCILRPFNILIRRLGRVARLSPTTQIRLSHSPCLNAVGGSIPADSEIRGLISRSREDIRFRMWNDHDRWQWRFQNSPMWRYEVIEHRRNRELEALAAIRLIDGHRTAVVSAMEMVNEPSGRALLRTATRDLKARGFSTIRALAPRASTLEHILRRSGFIVSHGHFRLHIKPCVSNLPLQALRQPELWWLNAGDFDVG